MQISWPAERAGLVGASTPENKYREMLIVITPKAHLLEASEQALD